MKPRRAPSSNDVYRFAGQTEDSALHVRTGILEDGPHAGHAYVASLWEPSPQDRAAIAPGANLELQFLGTGVPPTSLAVTREQPLSRPQHATEGDRPRAWLELDASLAVGLLLTIDAAAEHGDETDRAAAANLNGVRALLAGIALELEELQQP